MSKKLSYLISFVLVLGFASRAPAALVAHWALDDGQGSTASDSSGNNHHGTIGGTANWIAGRVGGALDFDGSSTYIDVADQVASGTFTLAMWIKPRDIPYSSGYYAVLHNGPWDAGSVHVHLRNTSSLLNADINSGPGVTSTTVLQADEWYHCALTVTTGASTLYINGVLDSTGAGGSGTPYLGPLNFGAWNNSSRYYHGAMDDIRVYDHLLTETEIKQLIPARLKAYDPDPADGTENVTIPLLQWTAGDTAAFHDVYFGTNPTPGVAEYITRQFLAWKMYYHQGAFVPGITYYWRIDEVEADGTTIHIGDVWSLTVAPLAAYNPDPPDGAKYISPDADLSWTAGVTAVTHDVYFGTDESEVANGTGGTFKGNEQFATYEPGTLAGDTKYYWRIDEVEQNKTTKHTGEVWSFRTIPDIPITDPNLVAWWKLDEGEGTIALDWSGHGNHGMIGGTPDFVPGYDGDALDFDGLTDYIDVDGSLVTGDFTLTMWIRPRDIPYTTDYYAVLHNDQWNAGSVHVHLRANTSLFNADINSGPGVSSTTVLQENEWYHCALTVATAGGNASSLYINGVFESSGSGGDGVPYLGPMGIGAYQNGASRHYHGLMDDIRVYNRTLTAAEIPDTMRGDPTLAWKPRPAHGSVPDIEHATPLTWSPGEEAAKHDVYLGTDRDAVVDADTTTTGIYRGRQDPNTYTPPEGVEMGQTYYWRIDEYNTDATISEGRIWNFAVADYLIVDDFESYDDFCNRIFYIWPDGWGHNGDLACGVPPYGGNGTSSTVGYLAEPYAEQTITHDGSFQSMPLEFLNDGSTGKALYSETERTFDPAQDWTRHDVKALTLWFRGLPASVGSFSYDPGTGIYTMTADGADIWGTSDEFHYAYKRLSGVGSIVVQVLSVQNTDGWAKAGVMIRETLDANSVNAMVEVTPSNGVSFQWRGVTGDISDFINETGITTPHWVKLTRSGNNFTAEHSTDGASWIALGTAMSVPMAADVYVGLALTSHNTDPTVTCTATFSDVTITGTVTGQWQSKDIGITSNDAEQLYVALEDNTGRVEDVPHPDANAVQLNTWQEWNIDLADFAPVDLTKVKKIYIGVGDRDFPKLGGAGMLYVDDIRLYQPRCFPDLLKPAGDFNNNCVVDYPDLDIITDNWLISDYDVTPEAPSDANLVAYYQFENNTLDSVAPYYHGDPCGTLTYAAGRVGSAIELDGVSDFVDVNHSDIATGSLSIALWCKYDTLPGGFNVLVEDDGWSSGAVHFHILGDGRLEGDVESVIQLDGSSALDAGQWYHAAVTYDTSAEVARTYIHGLLDTEATGFGAGTPWVGPMNIGAWDGSQRYFDGAIDDVRIYDRALTQAEIGSLAGKTSVYTQPLYPLLTPPDPDIDMNSDGTIDLKDYALLADTFLDELLWP